MNSGENGSSASNDQQAMGRWGLWSGYVAKLLAYYHLVADERDIRLSVSGAGNVLGDKLMIDRAVSNLLSNALRYTPVGETISVTIHEAERTVTLSVENPGGTIEPEHLDKLGGGKN